MLPETSKNISLFPSFDDLPNPPIDEIVEPKSFRNILVRAFCYTVMVPLCVLFFFLEQQIQSVSDTTDASQLAVAKTVAAETNDFVNHTADLIRIATVALDEGGDSSAVRRIFTGVFRQKPDLHVLSWITADGKTVTVGPFKEDGLHWELDNKEKRTLQRLSEDAFPEMVLQEDDTDEIDRHRFLSLTFNPTVNSHKDGTIVRAVLIKDRFLERIKASLRDTSFDVVILDKNRRVFLSSDGSENAMIWPLTVEDESQLALSPSGRIFERKWDSDKMQISAAVWLPTIDWVVLVNQSRYDRDTLMRDTFKASAIVVMLALLATVLIALYIAGPINQSVQLLSERVKRFGETEEMPSKVDDQTLMTSAPTEIIELSQTFEEMADTVMRSRKDMQKLNAQLEETVAVRTGELRTRNDELAALHGLLMPVNESTAGLGKIIDVTVEQCRRILHLHLLSFKAENDPVQEAVVNTQVVRIPVKSGSEVYGHLIVGPTDELTPDRRASLIRLANSLGIVLANDRLVKQLAREHQTLDKVFESITDGILLIGKSGRVIYANETAAKVLGEPDTLIGADAKELLNSKWKAVNGRNVFSDEGIEESHRYVSQDAGKQGRVIDIVNFKVSDLPGLKGERCGLLIRDITKEAQIETMKNNLISVVTHELKTPVTALRLQAESLIFGLEHKNESTEETARELVEESQRLGQLIDDLLDVSRLESGSMKLCPRLVQIASLVDRAARLTQSRYAIRVVRSIDPEAEVIMADPDRIIQVFVNLFNNAARYKKARQEEALCEVSAQPEGNFVKITVKDYGSGIGPNHLKHIFERFYQVDMTTTRAKRGTGLGLSIVDGIVKEHGGSVEVASEVNESTCFTIRLPY